MQLFEEICMNVDVQKFEGNSNQIGAQGRYESEEGNESGSFLIIAR
jgi:hypothetical protein